MGGWRDRGWRLLVGSSVAATATVAGVELLTPLSVSAATFVVDSGDDAVDASPGDATCDDGTGACTLRAAIQEANALGGSHTITIDTSVTGILIDLAGDGEDAAATGDLDVTATITIAGYYDVSMIGVFGFPTPQMSSGPGFDDRAFEIHAGGSLTFYGLGMWGFAVDGDGGAISNHGTLAIRDDGHPGGTLDHHVIQSTSATEDGGAVFNDVGAVMSVLANAIGGGGTTRITSPTAGGDGGGIYNLGQLTMTGLPFGRDIYLDSGSATGEGGGVYNAVGATFTLNCRAMTRFNRAVNGGDIANYGTLVINGGSVDGGAASGLGGGLYNAASGTATLRGCDSSSASFTRNAAPTGGAIYTLGVVTVDGWTTLNNNGRDIFTSAAVSVDGGGLYVAGGGSFVDTATGQLQVSEAYATNGAGVYVDDLGTLTLDAPMAMTGPGSSIFANTASGSGGGIYAALGSNVALTGTTVEDNSAVNGAGAWVATVDFTATDARFGFDNGSTQSGNVASGAGGGLYVDATGVATLNRVSLVGNESTGGGSAVELVGTLNATNVTIDDVDAIGGEPAIVVNGGNAVLNHVTMVTPAGVTPVAVATGSATIGNSLFVPTAQPPCSGNVVSNGNNVSTSAGCLTGTNDVVDVDASLLAALAEGWSGTIQGVTQFRALVAGNPAIDHVRPICVTPSTDQVGNARPLDGDADAAPWCDAGAFELLGSGGPDPDPEPDPGGGKGFQISGTLYDERDGTPLDDACALVLGDEPVHTAADGTWSMNLQAGTYTLVFFPCTVDGDPIFTGPLAPEWWQNRAVVLDPANPAPNPGADGAVDLVVTGGMSGLDACLAPLPGPGTSAMPCQSSPPDPSTPDSSVAPTSTIAGTGGGSTTTSLPAGVTTTIRPASELPRTGGSSGRIAWIAVLFVGVGMSALGARRVRRS